MCQIPSPRYPSIRELPSPTPVAAKANGANSSFLPRSLGQVRELLAHKLVYVVVVPILDSVDVAQPTVPPCPPPIPYAPLGVARHLAGCEVPDRGRGRSRQTKKGLMTRSVPNPWLPLTRTARRTHARTRA